MSEPSVAWSIKVMSQNKTIAKKLSVMTINVKQCIKEFHYGLPVRNSRYYISHCCNFILK